VSAPVFLVAPAELAGARPGGRVLLGGAEGRHAVAVRRLREGEEIVLADGAGTGVHGTVAAVRGRDTLEVAVTAVSTEPEPAPRLTVVQALPKGERGELAVAAMTEVGVDAIVPWTAARCVTQWKGERGAKSLAKWRATARESAKQSRRLRVPEVTAPMTTRQAAELMAAAGFAAVLHEDECEPLAAAPLPATGSVVLVVGPEGGITPDEIATFTATGARTCRLGPTVLRTSTAGVAAAAVVLARTGRWA
jgi:16S rRNA (uracil1498-N3)-methyltransferase